MCKRFQPAGCQEQFWFPAFRPGVQSILPDAVRIVKRRFSLNEDFMFPPGYFTELYMLITDFLDTTNHFAGLWEDSMAFETTYEEMQRRGGAGEFLIRVYISVTPARHFDLVVCSNNPEDRLTEGTTNSDQPHRVWNWLNRVRGFVYSLNGGHRNLVKEWPLHPLHDGTGARELQEVLVGKAQEVQTVSRKYYYGSCSKKGKTLPVEVCTKEELSVLEMKLQQDLIDVDRECRIDSNVLESVVREQLTPMVEKVKSLERTVCSLGDDTTAGMGALSIQLMEVATGVDALETETNDVLQQSLASTRAIHTHLLDDLDGVHEFPLFPVFSSKHKKRQHFVCPVCLCKAVGPTAGPKGKGYAVPMHYRTCAWRLWCCASA